MEASEEREVAVSSEKEEASTQRGGQGAEACLRSSGLPCRLLESSGVTLGGEARGEWVKEGEEASFRPSHKFAPSVKMWAGSSWEGKTPLYFLPKSLKGKEYLSLIKEKLEPDLLRLYPQKGNLLSGSKIEKVFIRQLLCKNTSPSRLLSLLITGLLTLPISTGKRMCGRCWSSE